MGEAINLVEKFKVKKVIFNCGEFNELEKDLIKVLDKKHIKYYSCIKELNIDNNKLYFLNNKIYNNENDNSNVIYTELNNHKFLFMGDVGVEVEDDLIEKYNLQDKMKSNKNVLFDKEYVKIKKDTFDTMNKIIDDYTNVMNLQPKLEKVYKEVDSYTKNYQSLKRENALYENEIKTLEFNNNKLDEENQKLTKRTNGILKALKKFFRKLLQLR